MPAFDCALRGERRRSSTSGKFCRELDASAVDCSGYYATSKNDATKTRLCEPDGVGRRRRRHVRRERARLLRATAVVGPAASTSAPPAPAERPNILLVLADDVGDVVDLPLYSSTAPVRCWRSSVTPTATRARIAPEERQNCAPPARDVAATRVSSEAAAGCAGGCRSGVLESWLHRHVVVRLELAEQHPHRDVRRRPPRARPHSAAGAPKAPTSSAHCWPLSKDADGDPSPSRRPRRAFRRGRPRRARRLWRHVTSASRRSAGGSRRDPAAAPRRRGRPAGRGGGVRTASGRQAGYVVRRARRAGAWRRRRGRTNALSVDGPSSELAVAFEQLLPALRPRRRGRRRRRDARRDDQAEFGARRAAAKSVSLLRRRR